MALNDCEQGKKAAPSWFDPEAMPSSKEKWVEQQVPVPGPDLHMGARDAHAKVMSIKSNLDTTRGYSKKPGLIQAHNGLFFKFGAQNENL